MKKKRPKGLLDTDRALHKTEHWTESLFICIYWKSSICLRTAHLYILSSYIKQGWRNISSFLLQKKKKRKEKNSRVRIKPTFVWNFETYLQIHTLILTGNSSPTTLRQIPASWKPHKKRYVLRKIKEKLFWICPTPYRRDRTASNNSPTPGPKSWTWPGGYVPGGMVTGQIEPRRKKENWNRTADHSFEVPFYADYDLKDWAKFVSLFSQFRPRDGLFIEVDWYRTLLLCIYAIIHVNASLLCNPSSWVLQFTGISLQGIFF